jgi:DNA polymerase III delta prime subunit
MQDPTVTEDAIYEVYRKLAPMQVRELLQQAISGKVERMREILRDLIKKQSLSMQDILREINTEISFQPMPRYAKAEVLSALSDLDSQATRHRVEEVQVTNVLLQLFKYAQNRGGQTS